MNPGVVGALGNLAGLAEGVVGAVSAAANAAGEGGLLSGATPAASDTDDDALSTSQYVDLVASVFAGSTLSGSGLGSVWKGNFKKKLTPEDYLRLQELGVISDGVNLTMKDKQVVSLLVLVWSASSKGFKNAFEKWMTARGPINIGTPQNLDLFREWGVIG